jgi:hypothetical protein
VWCGLEPNAELDWLVFNTAPWLTFKLMRKIRLLDTGLCPQRNSLKQMGLLGWLTKRKKASRVGVDAWHRQWKETCAAPSLEAVAELGEALDALTIPQEELEIEQEMLDGLRHLLERRSSSNGALPLIETGHRVVGTDRCHFSAPASVPDESSQQSGRLFLTDVRAIFAGGGKSTTTIPWHAVSDVLQQDRDVILVRRDRDTIYRFRCNVFADALEAAWLARTLSDGFKQRLIKAASDQRGV